MNLLLFERPFESVHLEAADPRAGHLRKVLRVKVGAPVFVGFANGPRGRAEVVELGDDGGVRLALTATEPAPPALPIALLIGLPRPHTAKRVLFDAASLGVQSLHFFEAERSEPSYAQSSLWSTDEWRDRLRLGVEQSFGTAVPVVAMHPDLQSAVTALFGAGARIALDNYEAAGPLAEVLPESAENAVIAIGPERGWSGEERDVFRKNGWKLAHCGPQVLRVETACVAAVAAVASGLGYWRGTTGTVLVD